MNFRYWVSFITVGVRYTSMDLLNILFKYFTVTSILAAFHLQNTPFNKSYIGYISLTKVFCFCNEVSIIFCGWGICIEKGIWCMYRDFFTVELSNNTCLQWVFYEWKIFGWLFVSTSSLDAQLCLQNYDLQILQILWSPSF